LTWAFELLHRDRIVRLSAGVLQHVGPVLLLDGPRGHPPERLGRTHPKHHSPYLAAILTTILTGAALLGFVLYDDSNIAALAKQGTWIPLMGMFGILIVQALVSFSIIYYFATKAKDGMHMVQDDHRADPRRPRLHLCAYLLNENKTDLAAGNPLFIKVLPWATVLFFAIGVILRWSPFDQPEEVRGHRRYVHSDA
jgi:amino acid transporter